MVTDNLAIVEVTAAQNQKEVTINAALRQLDNATQDGLPITITGNRTLTASEFNNNFLFELSGTPAAFDLNVPANKRFFGVENSTGVSCTVQVTGGGGTNVVVKDGERVLLYCDATNVLSVTAAGGASGATFEGARVRRDTNQSISNVTTTDIIWESDDFSSILVGTDSVPMWLGANFDFVDGDVTLGTDQITETGHGKVTGQGPYTLTTTGTLPTGLALATNYWIIRVDANEFQLASSYANAIAGTQIDITALNTGTHTLNGNTRLGIPDGVSRIEAVFNLALAAGGTADTRRLLELEVLDNADVEKALIKLDVTSGDTNFSGSVSSGVVSVVAGDYIVARVRQESTVSLNAEADRVSLSVKVV